MWRPWLPGLAAFAWACGAPAPPPDETRPAEAATSSEALSSIDCTEATDTGYTQGNPFPITLVTVDGKPVERDTANAYYVMAQAAAAAGVNLAVVSGFRTMTEQQYLYACYVNCNCNGCNLAAQPGYSNHQSGHALDLNTSASGVYAWLDAHAASFGFTRTVPSEDWHWEWWGGGPGGGPCGNALPTGHLDGAGCDFVSGWAFDPDASASAIDVHLYFGGPVGTGAPGVPVKADVTRPDLCSVIGSCEHGFRRAPPLSLFDGVSHPVHAYGIDLAGGTNPELGTSPQSMNCPATLPAGVRRHVPDPASFAAWQFDLFWDALPASDAVIAALPEEAAMQAAPKLVVADDGSPEVWLLDGARRRHVPSPEVMQAWRFSFGAVATEPAGEVHALAVGPVVRSRPVLVKSSTGKIDLIDDSLDGAPTGGASSGGAGGSYAGGSGGKISPSGGQDSGGSPAAGDAESSDAGSCGCRAAGQTPEFPLAVLWFVGLFTRRRRDASSERR